MKTFLEILAKRQAQNTQSTGSMLTGITRQPMLDGPQPSSKQLTPKEQNPFEKEIQKILLRIHDLINENPNEKAKQQNMEALNSILGPFFAHGLLEAGYDSYMIVTDCDPLSKELFIQIRAGRSDEYAKTLN